MPVMPDAALFAARDWIDHSSNGDDIFSRTRSGESGRAGSSPTEMPEVNRELLESTHRPADQISIHYAAQCFRSGVILFGRSTVDMTTA
jgi:hypothetical protein